MQWYSIGLDMRAPLPYPLTVSGPKPPNSGKQVIVSWWAHAATRVGRGTPHMFLPASSADAALEKARIIIAAIDAAQEGE